MIPVTGTRVTYPAGDTTSTGTVLHVAALQDGRSAVILDVTAFHPVDTAWPDQPADRGILRTDGADLAVIDAVVGATQGEGLLLGADVPVRTGSEGWTFVVAHIVDGPGPAVGTTVSIEADAAYRSALSIGHTACHLASLALDAALAGAWRKDVQTDALGAPAFDALAIQESRIHAHGSRDVYRIGKSLRRRGFDPAAFDDPDVLRERVDGLLSEWIEAGGDVSIERDGDALADRRAWMCSLPGGDARIPCGGTHVSTLSALRAVSVTFDVASAEGGTQVVMTTTAVPA